MEEVMPSEELSKEYVRSITAHKGIQVICCSKPKTLPIRRQLQKPALR